MSKASSLSHVSERLGEREMATVRDVMPNANCAVWTPEGDEIVFCSRTHVDATLWRIRADGSGRPAPLNIGGNGAYWPEIARHGNGLLYTKHLWNTNILRLELDASGHAAGPPEKFISSSRDDGW